MQVLQDTPKVSYDQLQTNKQKTKNNSKKWLQNISKYTITGMGRGMRICLSFKALILFFLFSVVVVALLFFIFICGQMMVSEDLKFHENLLGRV